MMSDLTKHITQIIISRRALLAMIFILFGVSYIADPINSRNSNVYFYQRLLLEFRFEVGLLFFVVSIYELYGLEFVKTCFKRLRVCLIRVSRTPTGFIVALSILTWMIMLTIAFFISVTYLGWQTHKRIHSFPVDFELRLRSEINFAFNAHDFVIFRRLANFHSEYYGKPIEQDEISVKSKEVEDRLAISEQLRERANVTMFRGQETYETMERLRASYAINRSKDTAQRIKDIEQKVRTAAANLAKDVDLCRIGSRAEYADTSERFAWLILTAAELGENKRVIEMGGAEKTGLSACQAALQMGEKLEERIRVMWGIESFRGARK